MLPVAGEVLMLWFVKLRSWYPQRVERGAKEVSHPGREIFPGEQKGHPRLLGKSESNSDSAVCLLLKWTSGELPSARSGLVYVCIPEPGTW